MKKKEETKTAQTQRQEAIQALKAWLEEDYVLAECVMRGIPISIGQKYLEEKRKEGKNGDEH